MVWFTPLSPVKQSADAETYSANLIFDVTARDTPHECVPARPRPVAENAYVYRCYKARERQNANWRR